jgi:hypothetical protein
MRRSILALPLALLVLGPGEAGAAPFPGEMRLEVESGINVDGTRYVGRHQGVDVEGHTRPFVPGQRVTVEVRRKGDLVERETRAIERDGGDGRFELEFETSRTGTYTIRAEHERTPAQAGFEAGPKKVRAVAYSARPGNSGTKVKLLNKGLDELAYVTGSGYTFRDPTARAVIAFRKVNGMRRSTYASTEVYRKVLRGKGGFELSRPDADKHVEFDWSRQVLVLAREGRARKIYHASSGKASTPTPFGNYSFYYQDRGTNNKGMVHSSYFKPGSQGGYAIHGYESVPTYPASHGCIRVPIPNALSIFKWIDLGDPIYTYR